MPAIINIAANWLFGAGFVLVARRSPAIRQHLLSWSFFFLVGFEALVLTPIATYLFRFYPQWSMLYLFDPQIFPELDRWTGLLSLVAVLVTLGAALGGYTVARFALLSGQRVLHVAPLAVAGAIIVWIAIAYWDRVAFIGEYDEFWQGNAALLFTKAAGWIGITLYLLGGALLYWMRRRFHDHDPSLL